MKKAILLGLVVVLLPVLAACQKEASGAPIRIGVLSTITGDVGSPQYGDLARLAAKEINEKGGVNGRPIEIVEEDDGGAPEKAILAFNRLADQHNVTAVIGPMYTHVAAALQPIVNQKKVTLLGFNMGTILDRTAGEYYFRHMVSDSMGSEVLIKYLLTQMPASDLKIGIIHDKTPVGTSAQATFVAALKGAGLNAVRSEAFEMGVTTFIPYLQRLKNDGVNALYPGTFGGPVMGIMRDLGVMGWRPVVVSGLGFGSLVAYERSGGLWDGVRYWSMLDFSRKDVSSFQQRAKQDLNQTFEGESTIMYYEAVKLAADVLRKSGPDRLAFRNTLESLKWDQTIFGPAGTTAQYAPDRHVGFGLDAHLVNQWKAGGIRETIWKAK